MSETVKLKIEEGIAVVTLNRPERRNAINNSLLVNLYAHLKTANHNEEVKVIVLTGEGKSFCSGIDLSIVATENLFDPLGDGTDFPDIIAEIQKPIIGAINGHAITGGFEMALNCDFLIASEKALFADTHVKVGIHPGWGMTQFLQQAVGHRRALQMSLTGQFIDARTALEWGLVNEVVSHELLITRAQQVAKEIAGNDVKMVTLIKGLIKNQNNHPLSGAFEIERDGFRKFVKANLPVS